MIRMSPSAERSMRKSGLSAQNWKYSSSVIRRSHWMAIGRSNSSTRICMIPEYPAYCPAKDTAAGALASCVAISGNFSTNISRSESTNGATTIGRTEDAKGRTSMAYAPLLQCGVHRTLELATKQQPAGQIEFGVTQILNAQQYKDAKQRQERAGETVHHGLQQRKRGGQSAQAVKHQNHTARREPAIEQPMVNMAAVGSKNRLTPQKTPHNGQRDIQQGNGERHQRRGHAQQRGRFITPDGRVAA